MQAVARANKPVDWVTLIDEIERQGVVAKIGGIDYISTLNNTVPSAANYGVYLEIVKRDSAMRRLINRCGEIINQAYSTDDSGLTLAMAEKVIFDIGAASNAGSLENIRDSVGAVLTRFDAIFKNPNAYRGIMTGFREFDKITNGLQAGDLIILAARPGVGKSAFAMNVVEHAALKGGYSCAVFSLEMPRTQIAQRMLCSFSGVSMGKAKSGQLDKNDFNSLWKASDSLSHSKIFVDDSSLITPEQILSKCRRLKNRSGLDLVVVDYIQLMRSGRNVENRQQEISDITRNLKIMAKELNVPILALSQLSRLIERREDKRPQLSDLRESGAIEQDADIVMFLSKDEPELEDNSERERVTLQVSKHRNGETGDVALEWVGEIVRFYNPDSYRQALTAQYKKNKADAADKQKKEKQEGGVAELMDDIPLPSEAPVEVEE